MPLISDLVQQSGKCTVGDGENTLHIEYDPAQYTPELEEMYWNIMNKRLPAGAMAFLLSKVLMGWDLVEPLLDERGDPVISHGEPELLPVETSLERLRKLPNEIISLTATAITQSLSVSREEQKNSRRGSLATRKANVHGGTT